MGAESRRLGRWLRLGAVLPLIGILVLHTSQIEATTWRAVTKTCPLDGTEVTNFVPGSTYISDLTPDFRPLGVGVDWFLSAYIMCPTCGFTARYEAFDDTEGLDRTRVLEALRRLEASSLFRERDSAIAVEMNWHNDPHVLAHLALGAKWLADDTGDPAIIQDRLGRAIEAHKTALAHEGFAAEQKPHYLYLIGELLRQKGEREEAIKWFDRAREAGDERIRGLAEQQRLLAVYQDKPVEQPLAAVAQGTPDEKVKAI
ncbi:MAG: DUF2225 domain-containing protein, partial [Candidatus Brocadiae bacterium]|nr:DUF2225 domain-containing protein [Candidatus Brocadiia bacterium]